MEGDVIKKNDREWTLSVGVPWIGGVETFYNRECYDTIQNDIGNMKAVLVKGTPGIGKTMFLQRVLVDIVEESKLAGADFPTINYVREEDDGVRKYRLNQNGTITHANVNSVDYCLSDSVDLKVVSGTTLTLEVASVKDANYNTFSKRVAEAGNKGMEVVMDLCTLVELMVMNNPISEEEALFLFDIFGGSARNFKKVWTGLVYPIALVEETLSWYFTDEKQLHPGAYKSAVSIISAQLNKSGSEQYNVVNSLMIHQQGGKAVWASKFMELLGSIILDKKETTMCEAIEDLVGKSGLGNLFESTAHVKLTTSSAPFTLTPLHKKNARNVSRDAVSFQCPNTIVRLRSEDGVSSLPGGVYGLPVNNCFPLVDAIVQPNILLQMTVSEERHAGAVEQLPHIRGQLSEKDDTKHMMVFVVPQKNLSKFKHHKNLDAIPQFVMCPDKVVEGKRKFSKLSAT
jgi:hypothetical protein